MPRQSEIVAEFVREKNVFHNGEPDTESYRRTVVAIVKNGDGGERIVKGEAAEGALVPGLPYRFYGHNHNHHKWGPQFLFSTFVAEQPATEAGIVAYLSQLTGLKIGVKRGIGKGVAYQLWDEYGPNAVQMLREYPGEVAAKLPKLGVEVAEAAATWLKINERIERTKIDLIGLLDGRGFPKKTIDRAIQKYGAEAAIVIRHNPYLLMSFKGCGFKLTDKMYCDLGYSQSRLKRQALCGWYAVVSDSSGHTWYGRGFVEAAIRKSVGSSEAKPDRAIALALRAGLLAKHVDANGVEWLGEGRKVFNEERLARYVVDALAEGTVPNSSSLISNWPDLLFSESDTKSCRLTGHQDQQLHESTSLPIGVLAGSPGTGKTFCAAQLIKAVLNTHGADAITVAAPTGKAAVRITEAMQAAGVYVTARTIHSLLGVLSADDGWHFEHHEGNPLDYRFVIIDESSMIDTDLMASLMAARAPGTHYLFVGDHRQLAPVGHGCPFLGFQRAGVPTGELTEVQRNSGAIVQACADIRDSHSFNVATQFNLAAGDNLTCTQSQSPEQQIEMLGKLLESVQSSPNFAERMGVEVGRYSPVWDVQIIVAVNKKSPLSRVELNKHLQGLLNPTGHQVKGNPFRIGDKIINLKNGLFPAVSPSDGNDDGNVYVANGEQAEAVEVEPARTIARLQAPSRLIVIPHDVQKDVEGEGVDEGGAAGSWDLAYAITSHKSQGSEWPIVAVMLDDHSSARMVQSRNWFYTAISRAKKLCVLIGKKSTADQMVRRDGLRRKTFLAELIRGDVAGEAGDVEGSEAGPLAIVLTESEFQELFASV